jgi:hypothetical protein
MQGKIIGAITPQQKIVSVNNKFGNTNIKGQQGTTRVLFDSIQLNGQTELRFFENAGSKTYPFTNIGSEGNRLNVGDTFVVQKIYFGITVTDPDTGAVTNFFPGTANIASLFKGEFNFQIANSLVIKQLPIAMFSNPAINPTGVNSKDVALETFTDIVIPPLLEFVATVRLANGVTAVAPTYLTCFIEGTAGIIAPQTTF